MSAADAIMFSSMSDAQSATIGSTPTATSTADGVASPDILAQWQRATPQDFALIGSELVGLTLRAEAMEKNAETTLDQSRKLVSLAQEFMKEGYARRGEARALKADAARMQDQLNRIALEVVGARVPVVRGDEGAIQEWEQCVGCEQRGPDVRVRSRSDEGFVVCDDCYNATYRGMPR